MDTMTYGYIDSDKPVIYTATECVPDERLEIVRCRDCKHFQVSPFGAAMYCERFENLWLGGRTDGFCYWGERK
jgi:hypothetical protein